MINRIDELLSGEIRTAAIAGHVKPDGDCVGSCTALLLYLRKIRPDLKADLYLEAPESSLLFLKGTEEAIQYPPENRVYDLVITCDASDRARIGVIRDCFEHAKKTVCIDHHISNTGFADINHIEPDAGSCSEVLAGLMDESVIDRNIAESLYTGIIHDTGVFQYRGTSPSTMRIAAMLMEKGIDFNRIIEESFYERTFVQNRIIGRALDLAELYFDGKVIVSRITEDDLTAYGADLSDLSAIVSQLRLTKGIDAAVFFYQNGADTYKASFRTTLAVDASALASSFGGGGHIQAAGCTISGTYEEVRDRVLNALGTLLNS